MLLAVSTKKTLHTWARRCSAVQQQDQEVDEGKYNAVTPNYSLNRGRRQHLFFIPYKYEYLIWVTFTSINSELT